MALSSADDPFALLQIAKLRLSRRPKPRVPPAAPLTCCSCAESRSNTSFGTRSRTGSSWEVTVAGSATSPYRMTKPAMAGKIDRNEKNATPAATTGTWSCVTWSTTRLMTSHHPRSGTLRGSSAVLP